MFTSTGISPSGGNRFEEVDPDDCVTMVQLAIQKCLEKEALCNEFYLQLIKQTTEQPDPNGRINIQNWRFLCLISGVVVPRNAIILNYLHAHLRRCGIDSHTEEGKFAQFASQVSSAQLFRNNITFSGNISQIDGKMDFVEKTFVDCSLVPPIILSTGHSNNSGETFADRHKFAKVSRYTVYVKDIK